MEDILGLEQTIKYAMQQFEDKPLIDISLSTV
jgi:hypothetical protein